MVNEIKVNNGVFVAPPLRAPYCRAVGGQLLAPEAGRITRMYRVIAIVGGALVLAGCSTMGDLFKPAPTMDTVRFESTPPGAEAKTSTGQSCRTPCALAMPANQPFTVEFTLTGYQPTSEQVELVSIDDTATKLQPNPVVAQLASAAPPPKPAAKPKPKKRVARKKVAPKPKPPAPPPAAAAQPAQPAAAPPPMMAPAPQAPSPWPTSPPQPQQ
jgi:hypothetical protein